MPLVYKEMRRVLKPGGTFALWVSPLSSLDVIVASLTRASVAQGYGEAFYPQSRVLSQLISEYSGGLLGESFVLSHALCIILIKRNVLQLPIGNSQAGR